MKQRQAIMKTYYHGKSIKVQPINLNNRVMVCDPKLKGLKLHPKCIGPNLVINKSKHTKFNLKHTRELKLDVYPEIALGKQTIYL